MASKKKTTKKASKKTSKKASKKKASKKASKKATEKAESTEPSPSTDDPLADMITEEAPDLADVPTPATAPETEEPETEEPDTDKGEKSATENLTQEALSMISQRWVRDPDVTMAKVCGNADYANAILDRILKIDTPAERWAALPDVVLQEVFVRGVPWTVLCEWMGVPLVSLNDYLETDGPRMALENCRKLAADVAVDEATQMMAMPVTHAGVAARLNKMAEHLRWLAGSFAPSTFGTKTEPPKPNLPQLEIVAPGEQMDSGVGEELAGTPLAEIALPDTSLLDLHTGDDENEQGL